MTKTRLSNYTKGVVTLGLSGYLLKMTVVELVDQRTTASWGWALLFLLGGGMAANTGIGFLQSAWNVKTKIIVIPS